MTQFKPILPVSPPNEGAHRLAWWLFGPVRADVRAQRIRAALKKIDAGRLEQLLAGKVEPGARMGLNIMSVSGGTVGPKAFYRPAVGGWGDRPHQAAA